MSVLADRSFVFIHAIEGHHLILGGLGFGVLTEVGVNLRTRVCGLRAKRLSLHAKVALATTGILLLMGTLGFWTFESGNLLRDTDLRSQLLTSFFASVTPRTAGFNSIDYAQTTTATLFLTVVLMTIGGCPGSTAGGIKATTLAVLFATARARLRGRRWASLFGRGVSEMAVDKAIGVVALAERFCCRPSSCVTPPMSRPLDARRVCCSKWSRP